MLNKCNFIWQETHPHWDLQWGRVWVARRLCCVLAYIGILHFRIRRCHWSSLGCSSFPSLISNSLTQWLPSNEIAILVFKTRAENCAVRCRASSWRIDPRHLYPSSEPFQHPPAKPLQTRCTALSASVVANSTSRVLCLLRYCSAWRQSLQSR